MDHYQGNQPDIVVQPASVNVAPSTTAPPPTNAPPPPPNNAPRDVLPAIFDCLLHLLIVLGGALMVIIGHDQGRVDSNFYQASIFVLIVLFMWQVLILFAAM